MALVPAPHQQIGYLPGSSSGEEDRIRFAALRRQAESLPGPLGELAPERRLDHDNLDIRFAALLRQAESLPGPLGELAPERRLGQDNLDIRFAALLRQADNLPGILDKDRLIGRRLGNYRVIQRLGQGGFGTVYLGKHVDLEGESAYVAIKVLNVNVDKALLHREASKLACLSHNHIVRFRYYDEDGSVPYLVMDYARNGTLQQVLQSLDLRTFLQYVRQVAEALDYIHENDVMHLDIKPSNILIGSQRQALVSDFGIALAVIDTKRPCGTLVYAAPEQLIGKPCMQSDQYALAIVVYEYISGCLPFEGSEMQIIRGHIQNPPPLLCFYKGRKAPEALSKINAVLRKALEKKPNARYPNVTVFARALQEAFITLLKQD
jgi:serine/threonine protein kinase